MSKPRPIQAPSKELFSWLQSSLQTGKPQNAHDLKISQSADQCELCFFLWNPSALAEPAEPPKTSEAVTLRPGMTRVHLWPLIDQHLAHTAQRHSAVTLCHKWCCFVAQ